MVNINKSQGFTLLEVLVSLAIMLFGLLGIAGLMVKGQHASFEAYQRQQALSIASDMAEKIHNNQGNAVAYVTASPLGDTSPTTSFCTASCTSTQIATYDLDSWAAMLNGVSETKGGANIGGLVNARGCVTWNGVVNAPVFTVSVVWEGATATASSTNTCANAGVYTDLARRRVVTVSTAICKLTSATAGAGCAS
jgi:type IV pilus assembly protein PilV